MAGTNLYLKIILNNVPQVNYNHVAQAAKKASGVLAQIRKTMACHNETSITLLYKGIVRPLLEYANVIWHPRYKMDMEAIETVQRRATKLVPELRNVDYSQRLKILKLPSMQYRLRRGDMIQVYKIVKGLDRVPSEMFFKLLLLSTHSSLIIGGSPLLLSDGGSPPASPASHLAGLLRRRDPSTNPGPIAWWVSVGN